MCTHTDARHERIRGNIPRRATHERKVGRPDRRSPGKRVVVRVRRGNGSDGEQRCMVWSLGPASHRRCHIDSRYRTVNIKTNLFSRVYHSNGAFCTETRRFNTRIRYTETRREQETQRRRDTVKKAKSVYNRWYTRYNRASLEGRRETSLQTGPVVVKLQSGSSDRRVACFLS